MKKEDLMTATWLLFAAVMAAAFACGLFCVFKAKQMETDNAKR